MRNWALTGLERVWLFVFGASSYPLDPLQIQPYAAEEQPFHIICMSRKAEKNSDSLLFVLSCTFFSLPNYLN